jgi:hypothetical protein
MPKMLLLTEEALIRLLDRIIKAEDDVYHLRLVPRKKILKLNLLFIVMDLLTLLAYSIVFVHGKLLQFSNSKGSISLTNLLATVPVPPVR